MLDLRSGIDEEQAVWRRPLAATTANTDPWWSDQAPPDADVVFPACPSVDNGRGASWYYQTDPGHWTGIASGYAVVVHRGRDR